MESKSFFSVLIWPTQQDKEIQRMDMKNDGF